MFPRSWHAIGLHVLFFAVTIAQNTARQTLYLQDQFSLMKPCATGCIVYNSGGCGVDQLAAILECPYGYCKKEIGAPNDCYCRGDNQAPANSYLSSCIKSACTVGDVSIDIASAVDLYNGYCTSNGLFAAAVTTIPPTTAPPTTRTTAARIETPTVVSSSSASTSTSGSEESTSDTFPTTTPPIYPTTSSETGAAATAFVLKNGDGKKGGLSTSDKIALGVGLGVGLLAVFVAIPGCYIALRR